MPLVPGDQLGPYEILSAIGAGGMGEVYKARDTRLDRSVAIKVLPEYIAQREDSRARFEREARAVASLNHPHICTLHDIGDNYMVMELVEGETLANRIEKGPIPLDQALKFAAQIADALDRAHRAGVTHRDVKPQNIMLTRDGAKVLDFGLAKSQSTKPGPAEETLTKVLTTEGTVMGTPQYMAPEQFAGKEADARSDIWAFGATLYEMVTGRKAFHGSNYQSLVGAILATEPAPMAVQPFTPSWLERLVRRCLAKDPEDRWQSVRDIVIELRTPPEEPIAASPSQSASRWPWAVAGLAALALAAVSFLYFRQPLPDRPVLQYTLPPPDKATDLRSLALSPDGRYVVFADQGLWLRRLDSLQTQALSGTEQASFPFWSPDSRFIAFFTGDKLMKIPASGGPAQVICDALNARGGSWGSDGVIIFAPANGNSGLSRVPATGGVPQALTRNEGSGTHRFPFFLPDGRRFFYLANNAANGGKAPGIRLGSLDSSEFRQFLPDESRAEYVPPFAGHPLGHLLFIRQRTLMAQPVDPRTLDPQGELFPVAEKVSQGFSFGNSLFSVSSNGILVLQTGGRDQAVQLLWLDRNGKELGTAGGRFANPPSGHVSISPDGLRVAISRRDASNGMSDIWIIDLEHAGAETRLTLDPGNESFPVWSPDGSRIAFNKSRGGNSLFCVRASNGSGSEEVLLQSPEIKWPSDWSRDGKFLIYTIQGGDTNHDLWALPLTGADRKPIPLLRTPYSETQGQLSPDGRWLAYTSNESGQSQIYVQPFALGWEKPIAGKWQISTSGGFQPRWRDDGRELFYFSTEPSDRKLRATTVKATAQGFDWTTPQPLFEDRSVMGNFFNLGYAPAAGAQRFLVPLRVGEPGNQPLTSVVVNWLDWAKK